MMMMVMDFNSPITAWHARVGWRVCINNSGS
jgi:hypothetical protein